NGYWAAIWNPQACVSSGGATTCDAGYYSYVWLGTGPAAGGGSIFWAGSGTGAGGSGGGDGGGASGSPTCGTTGLGGGIGINLGVNADAGVGAAGASASGSVAGGLFYDSSTGASAGTSATGTAVAYAGSSVAAAPSQNVQPVSLGAFAGAGASIFFTNARSVQQLSGPFTTYSANIGIGPAKFSVQFASGGPIKVLSIGPPFTGVSIGGSITRTVTNTVTQKRGCG